MAQQTDAQLATLATNAGLTGQDLEIAVAVLIAISDGKHTGSADELRRYLERARAAIQAQSSTPTAPPATPQVPTPATPQTPSTSQQNPVQGILAEFAKLIETIAKLQNPAGKLAKAAQIAGNTAVSEGAFSRVAGAAAAKRGNRQNAQDHADRAMKGKGRVDGIAGEVDKTGKELNRFDNRTGQRLDDELMDV